MPIDTLDKLTAALQTGVPQVRFVRASGNMTYNRLVPMLLNWTAGTVFATGFPGPSAPPASSSTATLLQGALTPSAGFPALPNPSTGQSSHLAQAHVNASVRGVLEVYDVLGIWRSLANGANTTTGLSVPAGPDPRNYDGGRGVEMFIHMASDSGVTGSIAFAYTNSDGVGSRATTFNFPVTQYNGGTLLPVGLAAGDEGVRSVQTATRTGTLPNGMGIVLARRIAAISSRDANEGAGLDYTQLGLANVPANAALGFVFTPASLPVTPAFDLSANLRIVQG